TQLDDAQQSQILSLRELVDAELAAVSREMSTYMPDSEISRFNQLASGQCLHVSDNFLKVVQRAIEIGELSGGSFNALLAPLVERWGFGAAGAINTPLPDRAEIEYLLGLTSGTAISIGYAPSRLCKHIEGASIDLSAIAKGHGVDRITALLERSGYKSYLVDIGGELRVAGLNPRQDLWTLAIEQPRRDSPAGRGGILATLRLTNRAVATSGDYRNYYERDGVLYSHTVDPLTGYPVQHDLASVTVVHSEAMTADAWATALLAAGPERAMALVSEQQLAVMLVSRHQPGKTWQRAGQDPGDPYYWYSEAMQRYIALP
ncbi:MAG: FAD:protein FMN transferase, partial [Pseudomonadales bacterium]